MDHQETGQQAGRPSTASTCAELSVMHAGIGIFLVTASAATIGALPAAAAGLLWICLMWLAESPVLKMSRKKRAPTQGASKTVSFLLEEADSANEAASVARPSRFTTVWRTVAEYMPYAARTCLNSTFLVASAYSFTYFLRHPPAYAFLLGPVVTGALHVLLALPAAPLRRHFRLFGALLLFGSFALLTATATGNAISMSTTAAWHHGVPLLLLGLYAAGPSARAATPLHTSQVRTSAWVSAATRTAMLTAGCLLSNSTAIATANPFAVFTEPFSASASAVASPFGRLSHDISRVLFTAGSLFVATGSAPIMFAQPNLTQASRICGAAVLLFVLHVFAFVLSPAGVAQLLFGAGSILATVGVFAPRTLRRRGCASQIYAALWTLFVLLSCGALVVSTGPSLLSGMRRALPEPLSGSSTAALSPAFTTAFPALEDSTAEPVQTFALHSDSSPAEHHRRAIEHEYHPSAANTTQKLDPSIEKAISRTLYNSFVDKTMSDTDKTLAYRFLAHIREETGLPKPRSGKPRNGKPRPARPRHPTRPSNIRPAAPGSDKPAPSGREAPSQKPVGRHSRPSRATADENAKFKEMAMRIVSRITAGCHHSGTRDPDLQKAADYLRTKFKLASTNGRCADAPQETTPAN